MPRNLTVRLSDDTYARLEKQAAADDRKIAYVVRRIIEAAVPAPAAMEKKKK